MDDGWSGREMKGVGRRKRWRRERGS